MYGYSVSGAESKDSAFANATNHFVPEGFSESIIPSLLFGSLISATDPGKLTGYNKLPFSSSFTLLTSLCPFHFFSPLPLCPPPLLFHFPFQSSSPSTPSSLPFTATPPSPSRHSSLFPLLLSLHSSPSFSFPSTSSCLCELLQMDFYFPSFFSYCAGYLP